MCDDRELGRRRAKEVGVEQATNLTHRPDALLEQRVTDSEDLSFSELLVSREVRLGVTIQVAEPQESCDLPGIATIRLLPLLLQAQLRRVHDEDLEPLRSCGVDEPTVAANGFHGEAALLSVSGEPGDQLLACDGVGNTQALLFNDLALVVADAHLGYGLVQVNPHVVLGHLAAPLAVVI